MPPFHSLLVQNIASDSGQKCIEEPLRSLSSVIPSQEERGFDPEQLIPYRLKQYTHM